MRVIGLISGTSMDGIDVAVADLELEAGEIILRPLGSTTVPYEGQLRERLGAALPPGTTTAEQVCQLDNEVGQAFADATREALGGPAGGRADLVVSHGQTLYHDVRAGRVLGTLQIGQPAWIAEATGLPVVADLRTRDIAAGGQGAPLVSMFDVLLMAGFERPTAALNLGGISNLTIVSPGADPVGFDAGPANALIDAAIQHVTDGVEAFDRDGMMAARGRVDASLLRHLQADPYYGRPPPKSTGKELFNLDYLIKALDTTGLNQSEGPAPADLVTTVTTLTAVTVADACRRYGVREVIASGGGTSNLFLMETLSNYLSDVPVASIDDFGIPSDTKEAYAFALLGFLTVHHLPGNVPSVTGASRSAILGSILPGSGGFPARPVVGPPPTRLRVEVPSTR